MKNIMRTKYLDRIIELNGTHDIKIITGIRRAGKSKLAGSYAYRNDGKYIKYFCNAFVFYNINMKALQFMI